MQARNWLWLALGLLTLPLRALEEADSGLLDLAAVQTAAAAVTPALYPDADDVLVCNHVYVRYEADGTSLAWDDSLTRILTEKGKESFRVLTRHYSDNYEKEEFLLVQILKPDGRILPVDLARYTQSMTESGQMSANIYDPSHKAVSLTLPDIEVGDSIRCLTRDTLFRPRVPGTFGRYELLEYTSPILYYRLDINAPSERPLRSIVLKDEIPGTVTRETRVGQGRITYRWEARQVPQAFREPAMPSLHTVVQRLLVSTASSWQDISRWYWNLCEPRLTPSEAIKSKTAELIGDLTDADARLQALFRFVSQEIRYMGITVEKDAPGYEPHDVSMTFDKRHGVCRDKAALLVTMLQLAGFDAFPVLIHAGDRRDEEVPLPYFNHAITAVRDAAGNYTLMDPTDENTRELLPAYLCHRSYLVATPEGETLRLSPVPPYTDNLATIRTTAAIDAAGDLQGVSHILLAGINDNAYRSMLVRRTPAERRTFFETAIKRLIPGSRLTSCSITPENLQDTGSPLQINLAYAASDVLVKNEHTAQLRLPRLAPGFGYVNFLLGETGLDQRRFPLETEVTAGVREELQLELPLAWSLPVYLPEFPTVDSNTLLWKRKLQLAGTSLQVQSEFAVRKVTFSPAEYLELKAFLRQAEQHSRKHPIFRHAATAQHEAETRPEPPPPADSILIEDRITYDLQKNHQWSMTRTVRRQILSYKGMKEQAEIKIPHFPAWESVKLENARVHTGNTTQEISPAEINLMDAPWVASAPRYPAEKILVASLPNVRPGSIIEYSYRSDLRQQSPFSRQVLFGGFDPVRLRVLTVITPETLPLQARFFPNGFRDVRGAAPAPDLTHESRHENGRLISQWTAVDLPALKQERHLPPLSDFLPTLALHIGQPNPRFSWLPGMKTANPLWDPYRLEVASAIDRAATCGPALEKIAEGLRRLQTPLALTAIRDFLARGLRPAGPDFSALPPGLVTPAEVTWQDGYGNAIDRATVGSALLKALRIDHEILLVAPTLQTPGQLTAWRHHPNFHLFGAVLIRVPTAAGPVWLNDLNQYAEPGTSSCDGALALNLQTGDFSQIRLDEQWADATTEQLTIDLQPGGSARITWRTTCHGRDFAEQHKFYAELTPEERRRHAQTLLSSLSQAAVSTGELKTSFDQYPGNISFSAEVPDFAVRTGDYCSLELPASLAGLLPISDDERSNPLQWPDRRRRRIEISLRLPSDFRDAEILPEPFRWTSPQKRGRIAFSRPATQSAGELRFRYEADLQPELFTPENYPDLLDIHRRINHPASRAIILRRRP